jgi:metal transporter CNNM
MTGIEEVFMLPLDAKLDYETLGQVVRSGHSRIPVYTMVEVPDIASGKAGQIRTDKRILGNLLVKSCVLLDPEDATPLATMPLNTMPSVPWDEPLTQILNVFQEGRSHMAIVSKRGKRLTQEAGGDTESVMSSAAVGMRKRILRKIKEKVAGSDSGSSDEEAGSTESRTEKGKAKRSGGKVASAVPGANKIAQAVQLNQQEMVLPSDAQLEPESMEKVSYRLSLRSLNSSHVSCSEFSS